MLNPHSFISLVMGDWWSESFALTRLGADASLLEIVSWEDLLAYYGDSGNYVDMFDLLDVL